MRLTKELEDLKDLINDKSTIIKATDVYDWAMEIRGKIGKHTLIEPDDAIEIVHRINQGICLLIEPHDNGSDIPTLKIGLSNFDDEPWGWVDDDQDTTVFKSMKAILEVIEPYLDLMEPEEFELNLKLTMEELMALSGYNLGLKQLCDQFIGRPNTPETRKELQEPIKQELLKNLKQQIK